MLISVIVPAYNYANFLPRAIASVLSQEGVSADVECIVVNDGSTDDTAEVLQNLNDDRIDVIHQPNNAGSSAARNTGIRKAQGDVIAFLDADDYWRPEKLARAIAAIEASGAPSMHFTMMQEFLDPSISWESGASPHVRLMKGLAASCCTLRRVDFDQVGLFDETLPSGEFLDWYLRATSLGLQEHLDPETLVYRGIHPANRDRLSRQSSGIYSNIIMRARRRAAQDDIEPKGLASE